MKCLPVRLLFLIEKLFFYQQTTFSCTSHTVPMQRGAWPLLFHTTHTIPWDVALGGRKCGVLLSFFCREVVGAALWSVLLLLLIPPVLSSSQLGCGCSSEQEQSTAGVEPC